jgi:hypothetical protein
MPNGGAYARESHKRSTTIREAKTTNTSHLLAAYSSGSCSRDETMKPRVHVNMLHFNTLVAHVHLIRYPVIGVGLPI